MRRVRQLEDFEGEWQLSRQIADRRNGEEGALQGIARFVPDGDGRLRYEEEGKLSYAGQSPMTATRVYLWEADDDGIDVSFEDGRAFHRIALDRQMPDDNHHCDPDFYHVSYDFSAWPVWRTAWRVVGPEKDYRMISEYRRAES